MIARPALILILILGAATCGRESHDARPMSRERFIQVNVELRQVPSEAEDAEERRRAVLEEHGTSEGQLLDFLERGGHTTGELREIWTEITRRLEESQATPDPSPDGRSI